MNLQIVKATGRLQEDFVVFSGTCPCRHCEIATVAYFDRAMKLVERVACSHLISHRLEKGVGVFFTYTPEK